MARSPKTESTIHRTVGVEINRVSSVRGGGGGQGEGGGEREKKRHVTQSSLAAPTKSRSHYHV